MALLRTLTCTPGFPLVREVMTFESVANFDAGGIGLFSRARRPMYGFEIPLGALTKAEAESLSAFHAFHQGGKPFLWNGGPWATVENYNLVAEGDGATRLFYLPNRIITASSLTLRTLRPSTGATSNWATSSSNSWPFSLSANAGALSFANSSNTIPVSGDDLMARYACRYLCLFEPGGIKLEQISAKGGGLWKGTIKLRETVVNFLTEGVVVPADVAFSPSDISGLVLWLKADAITGLNDGDAVTTWNDSSGLGNDATQGTAANKPLYKTSILNNKPIVRFDGSNDFLANTGLTGNVGTVIVVVKWSGANPFAEYYAIWSPASGGVGEEGVIANGAGGSTLLYTAGRFGSNFVINGISSTDFATGGFNSFKTVAATDTTPQGATGGVQIGKERGDTVRFWNGDIAEIIQYDNTLSVADRQSVENYLNTKYAIY